MKTVSSKLHKLCDHFFIFSVFSSTKTCRGRPIVFYSQYIHRHQPHCAKQRFEKMHNSGSNIFDFSDFQPKNVQGGNFKESSNTPWSIALFFENKSKENSLLQKKHHVNTREQYSLNLLAYLVREKDSTNSVFGSAERLNLRVWFSRKR